MVPVARIFGDEEETLEEEDELKIRLWDENPELLETPDGDDNMPLHKAAEDGRLGLMKVLVHRGADVTALGEYGQTALHRAVYWGHTKMAAFLLSKGAGPGVMDELGVTPLMEASTGGHLGVVQMLVQHMEGQGLDERDCEGRTALQFAAGEGHEDVVAFLLGQGAQAAGKEGCRAGALMDACGNSRLGVVKMLLAHMKGQGLSDGDEQGRTALHYAARFGADEVLRLLLLSGADPTRTNRDGHTPLTIAQQRMQVQQLHEGVPRCVQFLQVRRHMC
jgi:ankyrin repeat protein